MLNEPFRIKQGDRRRYLYCTLGQLDENDEVSVGQSLLGATVTFSMLNVATGEVVINKAAVVVDDEDLGQVHYEWALGDTDVAGDFKGEFEADYGGRPETFPNDMIGFKIKITPQIA